ncbi:MAG: hypothetical protein AAFZ58_00800 [Pseudomonadota bacterium]
MARTSFLYRTDPAVLDALKKWAEDDLRSVNAQLEFIVRKALRDAGRTPKEPKSR